METLAFNPAHQRQDPYMSSTYQGIGSQISTNHTNNLGILNAESYDDGRMSMSAQEARELRLKHQAETNMPFGVTEALGSRMDLEMRTDSDEFEKGTRSRRKHKIETQNAEDEEEARKKARGRPRVDTKDETAADVSCPVCCNFYVHFMLCSVSSVCILLFGRREFQLLHHVSLCAGIF